MGKDGLGFKGGGRYGSEGDRGRFMIHGRWGGWKGGGTESLRTKRVQQRLKFHVKLLLPR